jgi:hypothetical protein
MLVAAVCEGVGLTLTDALQHSQKLATLASKHTPRNTLSPLHKYPLRLLAAR